MTETEKKALALVNEVALRRVSDLGCCYHHELEKALCRAIEQHDAFRQEVSDAVEAYLAHMSPWPDNSLRRFIIPKPDPLTEVLNTMMLPDYQQHELRAALAARGLEVRNIWEGE